MFRPALIRTDDPAYRRASDAAFAVLRDAIADCQRRAWRPDRPDRDTGPAWAFAHGIATLRLSASLARHFPDRSPGVAALLVEVLAG